jgi:hypothetical protein
VRKIILEHHALQDVQRHVTPNIKMSAMDIGLIVVVGQKIPVYLKESLVLRLKVQDTDRMDIKDNYSDKIP